MTHHSLPWLCFEVSATSSARAIPLPEQEGRLAATPGNRHGLGQFEGDDAFCRHGYVLVAGKSGARSASAGSEQAPDQGPLPAASQTANERSATSTAANEPSGAFAFAFGGRLVRGGADRIVTDSFDGYGEISGTLEPTLPLGSCDHTGDRGTGADDSDPADHHRLGQNATEAIADVAVSGTDRLLQPNHQRRAGRHG